MSLEPLTPEEVTHARAVLDDAANTVGYATWMTNADWGRTFGDVVFGTEDDAAIRYLLAEGGESFRMRYQSAKRLKARRAATDLAKVTKLDPNDQEAVDAAFAKQLDFEVNAEGLAPLPLRDTTHEFLVIADESMGRKLVGMEQNRTIIRRARLATQGYPDQTIGDLVRAGLISVADLFRESA